MMYINYSNMLLINNFSYLKEWIATLQTDCFCFLIECQNNTSARLVIIGNDNRRALQIGSGYQFATHKEIIAIDMNEHSWFFALRTTSTV